MQTVPKLAVGEACGSTAPSLPQARLAHFGPGSWVQTDRERREAAVLKALRKEAEVRHWGDDPPRSYGELVVGVSARQVQYIVSKHPDYALGHRRARLLPIEERADRMLETETSYTRSALVPTAPIERWTPSWRQSWA